MAGQNIDLSKEERAVTEGISSGNTAVGEQVVGKTFADSIVQKLAYVSPLYAQANKIVTSQPHQIPVQAFPVSSSPVLLLANTRKTAAEQEIKYIQKTNRANINPNLIYMFNIMP